MTEPKATPDTAESAEAPADTPLPTTSASEIPSADSAPASASDATADATSPAHRDEPRDSEAHAAEASETVSAGDAVGEGEGEGGEPEAGEAETAEGEGPKKKRRRRRRKKKSAAGDVAAEGGPVREAKGEARPDDERRHAAPFIKWFEGHTTRRHAFAAGEIVAGRVSRIEDGAFVVDLFGKADAIVDIYEPREIEPMPEPAPDAAPTEETSDGDLAAEIAESGEAPEAVAQPESIAADTSAQASVTTEEGAPSVVVSSTVRISDVPSAPLAEGAPEPASAEAQEGEDEEETTAAPELGPPPEPPAIGEIYRGRVGSVSESGHIAIVNRAVDRKVAKARILAARENKRRVAGVVFGFNRGGFDVVVDGVRVFCPASGMALEDIDDPLAFIGKRFEFTVPPRKGGGQGIVVSRKSILERGLKKQRRARLRSLTDGQVLRGRVTQVREYGLFVDLGDGVEGMVHQSEIGWTRGVRPADVAKPGDEVDVKVLKVSKEKQGRVALSMRELLPDPWNEHKEALAEGTVHKGRVVRATDFGAFIELVPGIEGLLHISELGKDLPHASQAVSEGDEIDVVVERVDDRQRRISLSKLSPAEAKAIAEGSLEALERPKSLKPGTHVKVVVEKIDHHGVSVQVKGVLGRRGRGYLPNRELGAVGGGEKRRELAVGSELEVKIIGTDRDGGLRVSIKGREVDEERRAVRDYRKEAAKQGFGTFGDLLRGKLGGGSDG
jgi:small subunit ribosomal protein S1